MARRTQEPVPAERSVTVREALEAELRRGPATARDLSVAASIREKDVPGHLEHLDKSARARGERLEVRPATCAECGFQFPGRTRLTKPGRCPECQGTRVDPPAFSLPPLETSR